MRIEYKKPTDETWMVSSEDATSPHTISGLDVDYYQVRGFSPTTGYSDIIMKAANGSDSLLSSFYVRPAGTTYGTGDGLSYENAWSGFTAIEWGQLGSHTRLYVCGTHNELLDVAVANTIIQGNYPGDHGVIDGQDILNRCFRLVGYDDVTISHLSFLNAVVDCSYVGNSMGIVFNNCTGSGSGNQAFQNELDYHVTYNNCIGNDNVDDGISLHGYGTVIANDCTIYDNGQGVHAIGSATAIVNRCIFNNNSVAAVESWGDAIFTANDSWILSGRGFNSTSTAPLKVSRCFFYDTHSVVSDGGNCEIRNSSFTGASAIEIYGSVLIERCFLESTTNYYIRTLTSGNIEARYCILKVNTGTNNYIIRANSTGSHDFYNCTLIGVGGFGRGIWGVGVSNFVNCNFYGLNVAFNPNAATSIFNADHCNVFNCASKAVPQNGGVFNETNPVTGDPLFADIENDNYSLLPGSSCIDTGFDTGFPEGIDTAVWGDSETVPVVTTKNQTALYDIGAYVYN